MEKIRNNLRTLFGPVKLNLIPNVSEFSTFILSYSEFAAIFGLKSPNRKDTLKQYEELKKANRYIVKSLFRLMKYAAADEMAKHDYLCEILLTRSDAFLVANIHHKAGKPTKGSPKVWYLNRWCEVVSLISKVRKIARDTSCKLELKRVWIDKKVGDFARGLGVPKLHWRVYTFGINQQIETTLVAKDMLTPWQHGGRSGKGTHTAWEQIMFVLRDKAFIFEFDIKGFYDNIITKNVTPFLGEKMASRVQEIVDTTKPTEFKLPPKEADKAVQRYEEMEDLMFYDEFDPMDQNMDSEVIFDNRNPQDLPMPEELWTPEEEEAIKKAYKEANSVNIRNEYKSLMEDKPMYNLRDSYGEIVNFDEIMPGEREEGREEWKNLSQEGRGFPQGLSFSPILSTNALERALPEASSKNLTMYMDDGLIYGNTKSEVLQQKAHLEKALDKLGISLAPEKSGWIRENSVFVKDSRFLGIKILEDGSLVSQTRAGTSRPFPQPLEREEYIKFCETLEINASTARITYDDILKPKGKEHVIWLGNVMGNILNYMYAPESSRNDQEWLIMEGRMKACKRILSNRHKTLTRLERYFPEPITRPGLGEKLEAVRLTSISSIASIRLLRYLREKRNKRVRA